jgi:Na+-transporting methylmalonyl-CoA/oxaloacetate decarboxylase gamma subunit
MDVGAMLSEGIKTIGMGIGVVFVVIAVFYGLIKLMMKIWPAK